MSKIGRIPVKIPSDAKFEINGASIKVSGSKGEFNFVLPRDLRIEQTEDTLLVTRKNDNKETKSLHGLWRVLLFNAFQGVTTGWERKMDFKGVGFKAEVQDDSQTGGNKLVLALGFSHPVEIVAPTGITFNVTKNVITVSGMDKQIVGQVAANIRALKPVEPYKGKGIKYIDEIPRRKLGKQAKAASAS